MVTDFHYHQCFKCEHIWKHSDDCVGNVEAHTCTVCGELEWFPYFPTIEEEGELNATEPRLCASPRTGMRVSSA